MGVTVSMVIKEEKLQKAKKKKKLSIWRVRFSTSDNWSLFGVRVVPFVAFVFYFLCVCVCLSTYSLSLPETVFLNSGCIGALLLPMEGNENCIQSELTE